MCCRDTVRRKVKARRRCELECGASPPSGLDIASRRAFGSRPQRLQFEFIRLDGPSEMTELGTDPRYAP